MSKNALIAMALGVWAVCLCQTATAEKNENDQTQQLEILTLEIGTLHDEVAVLHKQLHQLRADMKKVLAQLKTIKSMPAKNKKTRPPDTTVYDIKIGTSPVRGPKNAPVTIVEFGDFQCPYCVREYNTLKKVMTQYPKKVKLVFKHFPLSFHKKAKPTHAATEFARQVGGDEAFWKMHDMIVAQPKKLDIEDLRNYAKILGLDLTTFDEIMADQNKITALLKTDIEQARKCKVRSTPSVFINGLRLNNRKFGGYKTRIDQIINEIDAPPLKKSMDARLRGHDNIESAGLGK